ncbi:MAG TPA: EfeM/EfeO family lipoprotein [Solirubrobacteraceae bacterium]|nr:EfeM/EfeO family lipoprotein [Solirubrobacteraceae bacterium]
MFTGTLPAARPMPALCDTQGVPMLRRARPIAAAAAALATLAIGVLLALCLLIEAAPAYAAMPPCSSYPVPGSLAPATAKAPSSLGARYGILRRRQRKVDKLRRDQLSPALGASGLILSGTRFLGRAAYGGRVYLIPAEHLLSFRLAPLRCLPRDERALEQVLSPQLRRQYRQRALCIQVIGGNGSSPICAAASGYQEALLYMGGTPGFGLVPNGVSAVTVTYQNAPPRTVAVRRNFFSIVQPSQTVAPCGVQWLNPSGSVIKVVTGCSYLAAETSQLAAYRTYVAGELSTLRTQVAELAAAIASDSLARAESAWLTAHLTWLDIGQDDGAYGCFGALGGDIDGLAAGHPLGTADPGFTGFHRIEFDLWANHDLTAAAHDTDVLQELLVKLGQTPLSTWLPATPTGIANWLLRPHEVLEDAIRDTLTANDDYGSGTGLASLTADVSAVRVMLGELAPLLDPIAPGLRRVANRQLDALISAIDATRVNGALLSIESLPTRQRQQVDADADAAAETLAPLPDLLTSTGRNAPVT